MLTTILGFLLMGHGLQKLVPPATRIQELTMKITADIATFHHQANLDKYNHVTVTDPTAHNAIMENDEEHARRVNDAELCAHLLDFCRPGARLDGARSRPI